MYKTNLTTVAGRANGNNILSAGTWQYKTTSIEFEQSIQLLHFLFEEKSLKEINDFLILHNISNEIFKKLVKNKLITTNYKIFNKKDDIEFKNNLYIDNITNNPIEVENKIKNTIFVIIGCGGIGNFMSFALNSLTPKKIILIDGDVIERSNLNRQLMFTENDIGSFKAETLKKSLINRNSNAHIYSINNYVTEDILSNIFNENNPKNIIAVLSGDNETALSVTTTICAKYKVPFLNVGYLNNISVIGPFYIPNNSCCPYCHNSFSVQLDSSKNIIDKWVNELNMRSEAPSSFVNNSLASSMAMVDIFHFLDNDFTNINSFNCRFGIENMGFKILQSKSSIDKNCKYCGNNKYDKCNK